MVKPELLVITKAKALCGYILVVTENSPKRFRFTLTSRMQNLALEVVESLYRANDVYLAGANSASSFEKRLDLQHNALTCVKLLAYMPLVKWTPQVFTSLRGKTAIVPTKSILQICFLRLAVHLR